MSVASVVTGLFLSNAALAAPDIGFDGAEIAAEPARSETLPWRSLPRVSGAEAIVPLPALESLRQGLARLGGIDSLFDNGLGAGEPPAADDSGAGRLLLAAPSPTRSPAEAATGAAAAASPDAMAPPQPPPPADVPHDLAERTLDFAASLTAALRQAPSGLSHAAALLTPAEVGGLRHALESALANLPQPGVAYPAAHAPGLAALAESLAFIEWTGVPSPSVLPAGYEFVAAAFRHYATPYVVAANYPFPEEATTQPPHTPIDDHDLGVTASIRATPAPAPALPQDDPLRDVGIEPYTGLRTLFDGAISALRNYAEAIEAARDHSSAGEPSAQPEHAPSPVVDEAPAPVQQLPAPGFPDLPDGLPLDVADLLRRQPDPAIDSTIAALRAYAARILAARSNPFPEETTAQPEHVPPPAGDDLATASIPSLPTPDFAALPDALPRDIAPEPAPSPDATVAALRAFASRIKALRDNPFPEELTAQPKPAPAPKLDAIETGAIRKPAGKSAERLSPHHIAWLVESAPALAPLPPVLAATEEQATPKLEPSFGRVRLLRQASLLDARTLQGDGLTIRLVGFQMPAADSLCTRVDGARENCRSRAATLIELMIQRRQLTCRYQQPEGSELAFGHCRAGGADLAEAVVARGYARRGIAAPQEIAPREEEPVALRAADARPSPGDTPRAVQARRAPPKMQVVTTWPSGPNGPKVVSLRPVRAGAPQVVARELGGPGGPRVVSIRPGKPAARAAQTRAPARTIERPLDLSVPRFVRFADVKPE